MSSQVLTGHKFIYLYHYSIFTNSTLSTFSTCTRIKPKRKTTNIPIFKQQDFKKRKTTNTTNTII